MLHFSLRLILSLSPPNTQEIETEQILTSTPPGAGEKQPHILSFFTSEHPSPSMITTSYHRDLEGEISPGTLALPYADSVAAWLTAYQYGTNGELAGLDYYLARSPESPRSRRRVE